MDKNIEFHCGDITKFDVDCIVNAANSGLAAGGGVCGAVFAAAGAQKLTEACGKLSPCHTGSAVITPGFDLKAKYIIHAVGPKWKDGHSGEAAKLESAYRCSLELARENGIRTIAFPLLSSGIFGYPKEAAWETAIRTCREFLKADPGCDLKIYFCATNEHNLDMGRCELARQEAADTRTGE